MSAKGHGAPVQVAFRKSGPKDPGWLYIVWCQSQSLMGEGSDRRLPPILIPLFGEETELIYGLQAHQKPQVVACITYASGWPNRGGFYTEQKRDLGSSLIVKKIHEH